MTRVMTNFGVQYFFIFESVQFLPRGGVGVLPYVRYRGMRGPKSLVFQSFWSEIGYRF